MAQNMTVGRSTQGETVSETVVYSVAEQLDADPTTLDPLYRVVDPDALNSFMGANGATLDGSLIRVSFTYCGCEVGISADGTVHVSGVDQETA